MSELHLIVGSEGSGKTTKMQEIVSQVKNLELPFCGVVSVAVFNVSEKIGYDAIFYPNEQQMELCRLKSKNTFPRWSFNLDTFEYGYQKMKDYLPKCETIIIDEVGKLEIEAKGWHSLINLAFTINVQQIYISGRRERLYKYLEKFFSSYQYLVVEEISVEKNSQL
ncbi:MAG: hypothetical protein CH6_3875 [Candidatus Kapaibacterium sp.]|nr:MAG: hypothetical protein CH6_3875 [Candidatus Kapabacteria bacterium]